MKNFVYRFLFVAAAAAMFATDARAASCVSAGSGNWTEITWTNCASGPQSGDTVTIAEGHAVILDTSGTIASLTLCASPCNTTTTLTHSGTNSLTINGAVSIYGGAGAGDQTIWDIAAGTATITGTDWLWFMPGAMQSGRTADVKISTGTLTVPEIRFLTGTSGYEDNQRLIISSNGSVYMGGDDIDRLGGGDIQPGTSSNFHYTGSGSGIFFDAVAPTFANLYIDSAHLTADITSSNVTGNVIVGGLNNWGYNITGNSGKTFQVNGNFSMINTSVFPTGFSTYTFSPTSNVYYSQTSNSTISAQTYGNLILKPAADSVTFTFESGSPVVAGNLTTGVFGSYTGAIITGETYGPSISAGTLTIEANSTFKTGIGTFTLTGTGTPFTKTGTFTATNGNTFEYTGNGATTTAATYYNLGLKPSGSSDQVLGGGTYTVNNNLTVGDGTSGHAGATGDANDPTVTVYGILTVNPYATLTTGSGMYNLYAAGTPLVVNGTLNPSTDNWFMFYGPGVTTIAATNYYDITTAASASTLGSGTFNVAGLMTLNSPTEGTTYNPTLNAAELTVGFGYTYTTGSGTITLSGTGTPFNKGGTFTVSTNNTFNYTGNGATTTAATYYNLGLKPSGSSDQVLGGGTYTVNNNLTVGDGANAGASGVSTNPTINLSGNLAVSTSAAYTGGTNAFTMSGTGKAISGTASIPSLTINGTTTNNGILSVATALAGSSTLTQGSGATLNIGGTSAITGLNASTNANTVVYNGTTADQTVKNVVYRNLTIDKGSYKANLGANLTVNNTLTFTSGNISTGANKVIIPSGGSISRTSGHVVGNLEMYMPTGATSKTFVIGDASNYTPVDVAFGNVSAAGYLTASTTAGDHPDIANSGINSGKSVNRYWSLAKDGTLAFNNYSATFNFVSGDIDSGADYNSFIVAKDTSGVWTQPTVGTRTSTSTQATGLTAFSDFQLGEGGGGGPEPTGAADISGGVDLSGGVTITTQ